MVRTAADKTGVLGFIDVLAVFIKQEQAKPRKVYNVANKQLKEANSSWARKYLIQVDGSITKWKAKDDDGRQLQYKRQVIQYAYE